MLDPKNPRDIKSIEKCRNIVKEIIDFGVNDSEILKIVELISLELENTVLMKNLHSVIKPTNEEEKSENKLIL